MKERLFHNRRPLGQKAKSLLREAKVDPDPGVLYVLQLAQWLLRDNKMSLLGLQERRHAHLMQDLVDQLGDRPPKKVLKLFLDPDHQKSGLQQAGEEQLLQGDLPTPESLGARLVENLYANLANQSPSLNPAHSLT
ncbi:MAG: hypothetical protein ACYSWU_22650 [Planctomycetota bacterium]|jgi:hypothetical protein